MLQSPPSGAIAGLRKATAGMLLPALPSGRLVRLAFVLAIVAAAGGAPRPAGAQESMGQAAGAPASPDVFTVSGIAVDATSSDAVSARAQAVREGQLAGLDRLLRRLVPAEAYPRLPPAASLPIDDYVQSFEIANEELSSTRYIAQLTVAYDPEAVRALLRDREFAFAQTVSMPVVVLPVYETPQGARLWQEDNPWWQAWADHMDSEQLLRLVLPLGDLEDMATLSVSQVQAGDPAALSALAARYGAEDALVVTARTEGGPAPEQVTAVRFDAMRVGREQQREGQPLSIAIGPARPLDAALALAVEQIQSSLDERWKSANLLRYDQGGVMLVDVPIARLADWVAVKQRLERLPEVSEITMQSFARDRVGLEIRYIGDEFHLEQALARLGLALTREGESWLLLPTGGSPSQGAQPSATSTAS
ncbi:MAG TPA: DUF2066 domain-containing protein [Geminicoccaceae bacterium]|nr:DUF2066 domain-containing protein [Geminicoccaceae bacterium]